MKHQTTVSESRPTSGNELSPTAQEFVKMDRLRDEVDKLIAKPVNDGIAALERAGKHDG